MSRLYCIDASIYIFRAWFAYPDRWFDPRGRPLNAVYGYTRFLLDFLAQEKPSYVMAGFDESLGSGFRHRLYAGYKSNRVLPDEALAFQLSACRQVTERLGIACFGGAEFEADDYLASAAALARAQGMAVTVLSRDKDLAQVLDGDDDCWWDYGGGQRLRRRQWEQRRGIFAAQVPDFLALTGDSIDSIPGVPGIGAVTAARLLQRFGSVAGLYDNLDCIEQSGVRGAARLRERLREHRTQVELSLQLTRLVVEMPELSDIGALRFEAARPAALAGYLRELGFDDRWCDRIESGAVLGVETEASA